jgi:kynurenine formamidase
MVETGRQNYLRNWLAPALRRRQLLLRIPFADSGRRALSRCKANSHARHGHPNTGRDWYEVHHILLAPETEIVLVETLANLDQVPDEFTFAGFPLNFKGRDGSPIRAVALINE